MDLLFLDALSFQNSANPQTFGRSRNNDISQGTTKDMTGDMGKFINDKKQKKVVIDGLFSWNPAGREDGSRGGEGNGEEGLKLDFKARMAA